MSLFRKSRHKPNVENTSKYGFSLIWGENGGVLSMRMQVILDSLFARPGSAPIWGVTLLKLTNLNQKETSFVSVRAEKETERT